MNIVDSNTWAEEAIKLVEQSKQQFIKQHINLTKTQLIQIIINDKSEIGLLKKDLQIKQQECERIIESSKEDQRMYQETINTLKS